MEGNLGQIFVGITGEDEQFDLPFAVGFIRLFFQKGIWVDYFFTGMTTDVQALNAPLLNVSNLDINFSDAFNSCQVGDLAVRLDVRPSARSSQSAQSLSQFRTIADTLFFPSTTDLAVLTLFTTDQGESTAADREPEGEFEEFAAPLTGFASIESVFGRNSSVGVVPQVFRQAAGLRFN